MSTEEKKPNMQHLELRTGAVAILEELLPTPQWYKDDPKFAKLLKHALGALKALPATATRPEPEKDETRAAYEKRIDPWAAVTLMFDWTDNQKDAAKKCVSYYFKLGTLGGATDSTIALIDMFSLDD